MDTTMPVTALKRFARSFAIVAILPVTTLMASGTPPAASARPAGRFEPIQPEGVPQPVRTATLEVVTAFDRSPLPGATLFIRGQGGRTDTWEGATDERGRYTIVPQSKATWSFEVVITAVGYERGYVGTVCHPAPHVVALKRAEAIGGIVRDERGRPIEGARVFPMIHRFARIWPEIETSPNGGDMIATTDTQGRWRSDALAVGTAPDAPIRVRVTHPDYVVAVWRTTAKEARAFSSVHVMRPGGSISGTIKSPFGRPVRGATVVVVPPPWDREYLRLRTDEDGRFRSGRCLRPEWGTLVLVVQAPGLAWAVREVAVTPEMPPQVIRLSRRRPLEGRVVDARSRPVMGAVVASDWKYLGGLLGWQAETDAAGRFVWYDAPTTGEVSLNVYEPSGRPASQTIARPEAGEVMITLP